MTAILGRRELTIAHTWDGNPITATERTRIRLSLSPTELLVTVAAPFHADPAPLTPAGPTPGLWEHEVVEVFVAAAGSDPIAYTEIELSPWGHHLVLQLAGVRQPVASGLPLTFRSWRRGDYWLGAARLALAALPARPWRVNAFAIHGLAPERRYLAAAPLPGPVPDFHQPERFPLLGFAPAGSG
jgi:hypothetical protein